MSSESKLKIKVENCIDVNWLFWIREPLLKMYSNLAFCSKQIHIFLQDNRKLFGA